MENKLSLTRSQKTLMAVILVMAICSVAYRLIVVTHLEQSSLLFIGIPTLLALGTTMIPSPRSATGTILKVITILLLMFGILAVEGIVCILMAAPLFYFVGVIIGLLADYLKTRNNLRCCMLLALAAMSFEGVTDFLSFDRDEIVVITKVIPMSTTSARAAWLQGPAFNLDTLPAFLKLGFPTPKEIRGGSMAVGEKWCIHFSGGEGVPGDLIFEVVEASESKIKLTCIEDGSHIAHWLDWKNATWEFARIDDNHTGVTLTLTYRRLLDPAWYFKPLERHGVRKAGEYFLAQMFPDP